MKNETDATDDPRLAFDSTPEKIGAHIKAFCRSIVRDAAPMFVPVKPDAASIERDCFFVVQKRQLRDGGDIVFGWNIWTWPQVWLKAEHHAVWRIPDGRLVDLTPKPFDKIVFVADPSRPYDYKLNRRVSNICKALKQDSAMERVFQTERAIFDYEEQNTKPGTLEVHVDPRVYQRLMVAKHAALAEVVLKYTRPSQPCICHSGSAFRDCHAPDFKQLLLMLQTLRPGQD
jgi:hypothetical protein